VETPQLIERYSFIKRHSFHLYLRKTTGRDWLAKSAAKTGEGFRNEKQYRDRPRNVSLTGVLAKRAGLGGNGKVGDGY